MGRILQISVGAGAEIVVEPIVGALIIGAVIVGALIVGAVIVGAVIVGAIIVGASASVLVPRAVNWSCQTMSCYIGMLNYVGPH